MGIPLVVLGCVTIPLVLCLWLLRLQMHGRLDTASVKRRWGFLYCNYRSVSAAAAAVIAAPCFRQAASLHVLHSDVMLKIML